MNALEEHKVDWHDKVDSYPEVLLKREEALKKLKNELEESDLDDHRKKDIIKKFYKDNHYYIDFVNRNRKLENLIIPLTETAYYGLCLLAEKNGVTLEKYTSQLLIHHVQNGQ